MVKVFIILSFVSVFLIAVSSCQRLRIPKYPRLPIGGGPPKIPGYKVPRISRDYIKPRIPREVEDQPLWLYEDDVPGAPSSADHPILPSIIDDVKFDPHTRTARSLSSPGSFQGVRRPQYSRRNTGYNRRYGRDIHLPEWEYSTTPRSTYPWDQEPFEGLPIHEGPRYY